MRQAPPLWLWVGGAAPAGLSWRLADELKVMCGVAERPLQLAEDHDRAVEADHEILGSPIGSAHFFNMSDRADGPSDRVEPRGAPDTVSCAEVRPGNSHACSAGVQRSCAGCGATERIAPAGAGAYRAEAHLNGGWHLLRCCGPAGKTSELGPRCYGEMLCGCEIQVSPPPRHALSVSTLLTSVDYFLSTQQVLTCSPRACSLCRPRRPSVVL